MAQRKIRVGIIGANVKYGWGTRAHIPALKALPQFELVAVCTAHRETAEETARHFGIPLAFTSPEEMARHTDVDLVSVCVRVPAHRQMVMAALAAGKHVFCEWPLGRTTAEAAEMAELAAKAPAGRRHMVGLQARGSPAFNQLKAMVADGYVGKVLACSMTSFSPGLGRRQAAQAWALDKSQGANTLTIAGGHSLDALCYCLGEFQEVSGKVATQVHRATMVETGASVEVTSPDNVLVSGVLAGGALASVHIASVPAPGSGFRLEVYGAEGTLAAVSGGGAQIGPLALSGARGADKALQPILPAGGQRWVPEGVPEGPPLNVAQMFARLGEAIAAGQDVEADFSLALKRHRLLDAIQAASDTGRRQAL